MTTTTRTVTIHVTSLRNDSVYGHETSHCDEAGCAGDERYWRGLVPEGHEVGGVYEIDYEHPHWRVLDVRTPSVQS